MTDPLDLDAMERGSLSSTARRLIAELRRTRKERDEAREKVHFYEVQYQDEIGINGLIEERDAALATVTEQKEEIERLKVQLEDELVTSSQSDRERIDRLVAKIRRPSILDCEKGELWFNINAVDAADLILDELAAVRRNARTTESPSQSDRERAKQLIKELCGGEPVADDDSDIEPTARALAAVRREGRERIAKMLAENKERIARYLQDAELGGKPLGGVRPAYAPFFPERQALDEAVRALTTIKHVAGPNPERTMVDGASRDLRCCDDEARRALAAIRKLISNAGGESDG